MEFIFFSDIKTLTGYRDIRSIKAFLEKLDVPVLKIGKRRAVHVSVFKRAIMGKYGGKPAKPTYRPELPAEKEFLADLQSFLTELP